MGAIHLIERDSDDNELPEWLRDAAALIYRAVRERMDDDLFVGRARDQIAKAVEIAVDAIVGQLTNEQRVRWSPHTITRSLLFHLHEQGVSDDTGSD